MAAELGHLARAAAAILCLLIFHVTPSDSLAKARVSGGNGTCISREHDALLSFKEGLLDPAGRLLSWQGQDCCQWEGVRCSSRTGHVIKLDLRNTYMYQPYGYDEVDMSKSLSLSKDELSSSLAALQQLRYLDLSGNYFNYTSIPVSMGSLENLRSATYKSNLTHLQVLDLSRNSFNAPLEQNWFFWDLTSLEELYLPNCYWYGPIPEQLGNMTSLQVIDFIGNDLVGLIPGNLQNLCNLEKLYFANNNINVSIGEFMDRLPRCSWSTIQLLSLHGSNMTGKLPIWIGNMTSLSALLASDNMITGTVPLGVGALGNLTWLSLDNNELNGVLMKEHFSGLLNLEHLVLSGNSLKMDIEPNWVPPFRLKYINLRSCLMGPRFPEWLRWQTDVYFLGLGNANLDDVIPNWFWVTFSGVGGLDVSGNKLRGSLPASLQHMSARTIFLGSNKLTGQVPVFPINITFLNLSSNSFSGSLPSELKAPLLVQLLLANNQITGTIPSSICQLTRLQRLDLSGNNLTGDVTQCWVESDNKSSVSNRNYADQFGSFMVILSLSDNNLSGEFPDFLQSASQLQFLDLSNNSFFGTLPKWLPEKMPQLRLLRVRSNMFSGHIPKGLTCLESLQYLDFARNNISGSIPWSLSNLKAIRVVSRENENYYWEESITVTTKDQTRDYTYRIYMQLVNLDLSCNSLTGQIPEEIRLLIGLTNLNLSSNQLIGQIPDQIGNLKQLESLDLSYNELSGEIPSGLSALTCLSLLNLSYNNLSSVIPFGPQLQVLNNLNYTYIGNPGLCGYPLSKNCSASSTGAEQSFYHEDADHISYLHLGMGIGFVVGLWVVFCTMLLRRTWAIAYFQVID